MESLNRKHLLVVLVEILIFIGLFLLEDFAFVQMNNKVTVSPMEFAQSLGKYELTGEESAESEYFIREGKPHDGSMTLLGIEVSDRLYFHVKFITCFGFFPSIVFLIMGIGYYEKVRNTVCLALEAMKSILRIPVLGHILLIPYLLFVFLFCLAVWAACIVALPLTFTLGLCVHFVLGIIQVVKAVVSRT